MATLALVVGGIGLAVRNGEAPRPPVAGEDRAATGTDADTATVFLPDPATEQREGGCRTWSGLRPEVVSIPGTGDRAQHALQALVSAPDSASHPIGVFSRQDGATYTVRSVVHDGSVITVDIDMDPWDPWPTASLVCAPHGELAIQQVVRTAQAALDSDDPVLLTVNGAPARGMWMYPLNGPAAASATIRNGEGVLEGTWDVVGLVGDSRSSVMPSELQGKVTLTFDDGELLGFTGCNWLQSTYSHRRNDEDGQRLKIEISTVTRAACDVEAPLLDRLNAVRFTTVADGYRYLHAENGMIVAQLRRR
ncbi:META domain-containing protein [Nocardioides massiliensis]|uniref:META domain-containing protein n=1 Tax=Nocardioides massiliensis TaxID=1325935 RepID=UPI0015EB4F83|nr:META domain-containing protein [Nocardioides massiliensis]